MERRSFLKWATHGLGAAWGAVIALPGIAYLIDARNRPAPPGEFKPTGLRWGELSVGVPKQAVIKSIRRDAWTLHPNDVLGGVWLVKQENGKIDAFTMSCPHLGCPISGFDPQTKRFRCPCHNGTFQLNGDRVADAELGRPNPAPRGMDALEIKFVDDQGNPIDDPAKQGQEKPQANILVKYQNFRQGEHDKIVKT
jgi:quinol---cytochrome c reductase iron-sulfur subunit, bacillus type